MTSNRIIRSITLCAVAMLLLSACSIYDEYPARRHYDVILRIADSTGQVLPDSVASVNTLYAFRKGIFVGKYNAVEKNKFSIDSECNCGECLTFVALYNHENNKATINEPILGESIHNVWLQLHTQGDSIATPPSAICHGKLTIPANSCEEKEHILYLHDQRAKARVYVKGIRPHFGEGNYRVVLEGLYSGITYYGQPHGKRVNYRLPGNFVKQNDWATSPVTLLPTGKEPCRLLLYKQDGGLLLDTTKDEYGKPLIINPNDDVVFYIAFHTNEDQTVGISIKVLPFEDVDNDFTFE